MRKLNILLLFFVLSGSLQLSAQDNFVGQIMIVPYNFSPVGWHDCDGSLMSIAENDVLFSLIGTTYGGDGQTTFALPDARGRVMVDDGSGPGLTSNVIGQQGGAENVTLAATQLPAHRHTVNAVTAGGTKGSPSGAVFANTGVLDKDYADKVPDTTMAPGMVSAVGASQPHNNIQPYLTMKCVIALYGIYPPRN